MREFKQQEYKKYKKYTNNDNNIPYDPILDVYAQKRGFSQAQYAKHEQNKKNEKEEILLENEEIRQENAEIRKYNKNEYYLQKLYVDIKTYINIRSEINLCLFELIQLNGNLSFLEDKEIKILINRNPAVKKLINYYIKQQSEGCIPT